MSSVKKLSLSGFKSTFKRKSRNGSATTRSNNDANKTLHHGRHGFVCENESSKTNEEYQNIPVRNGHGLQNTKEILPNGDENTQKRLEMKTGRWGFRQKSDDKSKICENGNGSLAGVCEDEPGSGGDDAANCAGISNGDICRPPSANGHIVMNNENVNGNGTGYIGARLSKVHPNISNSHSFQEVDNANHHYINDSKLGSTTFLMKSPLSSGTSAVDAENVQHRRYNGPLPLPCEAPCDNELSNVNVKCDINENAEILDERHENGAACSLPNQGTVSDLPPAIPPKPASLYNNGEWCLNNSAKSDHDQTDVDTSILSLAEDQVPPRPPARSKTRHGIDTNLPFYKQYLELSEKCSHDASIYEAVRVETGLETGGLAGELSKLPRQPWYWGPMSHDEAVEKLEDAMDGSFLVRDSSDDRYLLTLSFKSNGRTLHTRIEHRNGLFSLNDSEGHASVIELIESAMKESQGGVFGYMNDATGVQNFPARITKWVSRFSEVKSLQYLCRFVIRETYPRHHIRHLPLPNKINEYILENQY